MCALLRAPWPLAPARLALYLVLPTPTPLPGHTLTHICPSTEDLPQGHAPLHAVFDLLQGRHALVRTAVPAGPPAAPAHDSVPSSAGPITADSRAAAAFAVPCVDRGRRRWRRAGSRGDGGGWRFGARRPLLLPPSSDSPDAVAICMCHVVRSGESVGPICRNRQAALELCAAGLGLGRCRPHEPVRWSTRCGVRGLKVVGCVFCSAERLASHKNKSPSSLGWWIFCVR